MLHMHLLWAEALKQEELKPEEKEALERYTKKVQSDKQDEDNYFVCKICLSVLLDPQECSKCGNAFCQSCIEQATKTERRCPLRCKKPEYSQLHRFAKTALMNKRFCCPQIDCEHGRKKLLQQIKQTRVPTEVGFTYQEAVEHKKKCLYVKHYCEYGCGERVMGYDMEKHSAVCK